MDNKYISIKYNNIHEMAVLFPNIINHSDMLQMIKFKYPNAKLLSAGFWWIDSDNTYRVGGHSVSLNISVRKQEDEFLLNKDFNNGKIVFGD